jgi:hypothetical protein
LRRPGLVTGKAGQRREILVGASLAFLPQAQARLLEDVTPPVAAEVREARRLDRMLAPKVDEDGRTRGEKRKKEGGW